MGENKMLCNNCKKQISTLRTRLRLVNNALHELGRDYHEVLPVNAVDEILEEAGFAPTQSWSFPGRRAVVNEEVGEGKWLHVSAYRMDSGRWEIVAYIN